MRLLVMLQNASRSGLRLARAVPADVVVDYANASPRVSWEPDGEFPADLEHIRAELERFKPTHVLACGRIAEAAMREAWDGPLLVIPHPACRVLTNTLLDLARWHLTTPSVSGHRFALRQRRGGVSCERLGGGA